MNNPQTSNGFIVRIKGADYYVVDGDREVCCRVRGRFRVGKSAAEVLPVVGDNVVYRLEKDTDGRGPTGLITLVGERKSVFARADVAGRKGSRVLGANLDIVFLVLSVKHPKLNLRLLDRMLVAAECGGIEPVICVNKIDLAKGSDRLEENLDPYRLMGYQVMYCSALTGEGVEAIRERMASHRSIMVGPSGTGKTSLISALAPDLDMRIGVVSEKTGKGKHTTSHFELHRLGGGYLGDTPGVREFGIWGVSKQTLGGYFLDFDPYHSGCKFNSCTHSHEPGCGVKDAVKDNRISPERYRNYLKILEELPDRLD
ncbi:MAG: ribosome small subunit-dependent GTPase A [Candidatus Krumholzibacteriota bacterium]|nr:ribosome small subunit-dependent GTPase A [Candidatus Krumholzibacteriota bacterium]